MMILDTCRKSTKGISDPVAKKTKYYECQVAAIKEVMARLEEEKKKCDKKPDKSFCVAKINNYLKVWRSRLIEKERLFRKYKRSM